MTAKHSQDDLGANLKRRRRYLLRREPQQEEPEEESKRMGSGPVSSCWSGQWYPSCVFTQKFREAVKTGYSFE